jgi:hypothetical protein
MMRKLDSRWCSRKPNAWNSLLDCGCSEVVQDVVEEVGDLRWRREWVGELGVLQVDVRMRKLEMNAVDADVELSYAPFRKPSGVKVACIPCVVGRCMHKPCWCRIARVLLNARTSSVSARSFS